jgi:endonuclease III
MKSRQSFPFREMITILQNTLGDEAPVITSMCRKEKPDPFLVLVGTLLSLRTKDETTERVMAELSKVVKNPGDILSMSIEKLQRLIYPTGFYRNKALTLKEVARTIVEEHGGKVPDSLETLLKMKGIGRKTANLVITEAYGKAGICVDTHVHRISNRLGIVSTRSPLQTEMALRHSLPKKYWTVLNGLLVTFGKRVCTPLSPRCTGCPLANLCGRTGVTKHR